MGRYFKGIFNLKTDLRTLDNPRDIEPLEQLGVLAHVAWPDGAQELDVVVAVELGHLLLNTNNMLRTISQRSK